MSDALRKALQELLDAGDFSASGLDDVAAMLRFGRAVDSAKALLKTLSLPQQAEPPTAQAPAAQPEPTTERHALQRLLDFIYAPIPAPEADVQEPVHDFLCVSRVFKDMQAAGHEGYAHEDGWVLMATADAEKLKAAMLAATQTLEAGTAALNAAPPDVQEDAARYRALRSVVEMLDDEDGLAGVAFNFQIPLSLIDEGVTGELLDAIADAARAGEGKNG